MKLLLFYLFTNFLFYLSKSQEIIKLTNYTIDYLDKLDSSKINCQKDSDCPEYSKCVDNNGNSTIFTCKFGSFLCPKRIQDTLSKGEVNGNCYFVNTELYDIDKQEIFKDAKEKSPSKPIIKTCPYIVGKAVRKCKTEKCIKDEDCLSGLCYSNTCVSNVNYIYRCTGADINVKCGRQTEMSCNSDEECYTGHCAYDYCSTKKAKPRVIVILQGFGQFILLMLGLVIGIIIGALIYNGLKKLMKLLKRR